MPIDRIVIAGGGIAGWLTAAALARKLTCAVHVVDAGGDDVSLGYRTLAEPSMPSTPEFLRNMGLDEDALLRASRGTFTLGRALAGWTDQAAGFHPYGDIGAGIGAASFHQLVAALRNQGQQINLANYALSALCAQAGRFTRPADDVRSVLSTIDYGIHVDVARYADALNADAQAHGVNVHDGAVDAVEVGDDGLIAAVTTNHGVRITGDLFIDCTGASAALIGGALRVPFEDWSHWLPCDAFDSVFQVTDCVPAPYTHIEAHSSGWRRFIPLQGGEVIMVGSSGGVNKSGRRTSLWQGNCIAIGGAAALLDPLASTSLHLVEQAITRLIRFFPHARQPGVEATEFNRNGAEELERARDFTILHYKLNGRVGEPFWDDCRAVAAPEPLAQKISLFESCGRTALRDNEAFEDGDWIALFDHLGVRPRRHDTAANGIPRHVITEHLGKLREVMLKAVATVPTHGDYIRTHIT
jgi:tryptophan 7-halogenase